MTVPSALQAPAAVDALALLGQHAPDALVAFGGDGARTAADLRRDAAVVARALPEADEASNVLLVFRHDRYAFAVALLAAWSRGHRVALPPNTRRETVWEVRDASEAVAILHDTESGNPHRVADLLAASEVAEGEVAPIAGIAPDHARAVVYTSGSTGVATPAPKSSAQLLGEAAMQAAHHGLGPGSRVVATVAPGHIYGLLFSVLAPLLSGGAFHREAPLHAETVAEAVVASGADTLVVVPAHVRALAALPTGRLGDGLVRVFSSTAPLDEADASAFDAAHGVAITEIFGSSETGGIAWRHRRDGARWTPLPGVGVQVDDEGRLVVRSPWAGAATTQDLVSLGSDGTFEHLGRVDGVVKIGGRRVSLRAVERALLRLDGVEDAAVLAVPEATGRGQQLLAALVADEARWPVEALREALAERFERSCLPRRFAHVAALPREDTGKLQRRRALGLFGLDASGAPIAWDLAWGEPEHGEDGDRLTCRFAAHVPENYGWYDGHFPGYPILAGAVQLRDLALRCVRIARPELGAVQRVSRLKFTGRIQPGEDIVVGLSWEPGSRDVDMRITRGTTQCSAGRLTFAEADEA